MFNTCVPPLSRFSSSFPLSLPRSPHVDRVPLSLTPVCLVVASCPHVYNLSCFGERALSSFSCGIQTFRSPSPREPPSGLLRTLSRCLAGFPLSSSRDTCLLLPPGSSLPSRLL